MLISKTFWDKLNDEERAVIQSAAIEARDYQRKVSREVDAKAMAEIKATGMEVAELSPEEMQKLRDAVSRWSTSSAVRSVLTRCRCSSRSLAAARGQ